LVEFQKIFSSEASWPNEALSFRKTCNIMYGLYQVN
jgi:hypothetical protein